MCCCYRHLIVNDCMQALLHMLCAVHVWTWIFCAFVCFAILMAWNRLALADLRAAMSPDSKAASLVFIGAHTSVDSHGF